MALSSPIKPAFIPSHLVLSKTEPAHIARTLGLCRMTMLLETGHLRELHIKITE